MAINTYATLQTAVANWLDRSDLTDRIPEFIALAEARMNRNLRLALMLNVDQTTLGGATALVAGTRDYDLPCWLLADGGLSFKNISYYDIIIYYYREYEQDVGW